jgi:hypothetical protein
MQLSVARAGTYFQARKKSWPAISHQLNSKPPQKMVALLWIEPQG